MKPRKWCTEIIAWANGEIIQMRHSLRLGEWSEWYDNNTPNFSESSLVEYRIKPTESIQYVAVGENVLVGYWKWKYKICQVSSKNIILISNETGNRWDDGIMKVDDTRKINLDDIATFYNTSIKVIDNK